MSQLWYLIFYGAGLFFASLFSYLRVGSDLPASISGTAPTDNLANIILQVGFSVFCISVAWFRGKDVARGWLAGLPLLAAGIAFGAPVIPVPFIALGAVAVHLVALWIGSQPAAAAEGIPEDIGIPPQFILKVLGGIVGVTVVLGGGASIYSGRVAAAEAQVRLDKETQEADARRQAVEAKHAQEQAAVEALKAQQKQAVIDALAKFNEIEVRERRAYDARELLLAPFTTEKIQAMLIQYAGLINQGNYEEAAKLMLVPPEQTYSAGADASAAGGFTAAVLKSYKIAPGSFEFKLSYPDIEHMQAPTDYLLTAPNSYVDTRVEMRTKRSLEPSKATNNRVTSCATFVYRVGFEPKAKELIGLIWGYKSAVCSR